MTKSKGKARAPVQKRGIDTREKIIDAAWTLFAEKGFFKTNARDIAKQAGVATGSFYGYFNNKKEVAIELIRRFHKDVSERALTNFNMKISDTVAENLDTGKKLVQFIIQSLMKSHEISPQLHREATALILLDEEVCKINRIEEKKIITFIITLLQKYKQFIRVDDLEAAAVLLYRITDEVIHRIMIHKEEIDAERLLRELDDMICGYLFIND